MTINKQRLLVVIVNYKTSELVCSMLSNLTSQLDPTIDKVCIVDNDSADNSAEKLAQHITDNHLQHFVELIASEHNGGFSYGNNLAIRPAFNDPIQSPDFYLLLNPDTIVTASAISELLEFMNKHPQAGIAGSQLEEPDGTIQGSFFRFHSILSELNSSLHLGIISRLLSKWTISPEMVKDECLTDWVAGASMMIRRKVFEDIGLMDEHYFLYFEETDFCLQAKRKGWQCWYVPQSRVVHLVGQSTGVVSGNVKCPRRPKYWFEARQYYFIKNHGYFYTMMADLTWGLGFTLWRLRRFIQRKQDTDPENMLVDFWRNSIFLTVFNGKNKS
ncbi:MAG: glycosyl transferase family 2 [Methylophaga sp.]|nr:MAG: glycosyl transferase family 2 [Methylophaga sp.]